MSPRARGAVADIGRLTFGGVVARLLWVLVHIAFLVGFRSRVMVLFEWGYACITFRRGARLITGGKTAAPELDASSDIGKNPTADEPALSASN